MQIEMFVMPQNVVIFLEILNEINRYKDESERPPAIAYKEIQPGNPDMFRLSSGHIVEDACEGRSEEESYLFDAAEFLPAIEILKAGRSASVDLYGLHYTERNTWTHTYSSPDDGCHVTFQTGRISGNIRMEEAKLEYHMDFVPTGERIELDFGVTSDEKEVIEKIDALILASRSV
jgi:hypothetical protein